jgi:phospholipid/cholesterol/gamma-HCH transport system substrate-binding protein
METRSNFILVGAFVLSFLVAIVVFVIWLSHSGFGERMIEYDIYFKGAVSGLKQGSAVHYRGVPIGSVHNIIIDPTNVDQILVRVRIKPDVPIKQDAFATLETQALTGVAQIQINGGTQESPLLRPLPGMARPVIPSKSSLLEQVAGTVPELLTRANKLIEEVRLAFNEENRLALGKAIQNIQQITNALVPTKEKPITVITELEALTKSLTATAKEVSVILQENRKGLKDLSTTGPTSLEKFLQEGKDAFAAIRRVSESLERSPSRFFYNDPKQGVKVR